MERGKLPIKTPLSLPIPKEIHHDPNILQKRWEIQVPVMMEESLLCLSACDYERRIEADSRWTHQEGLELLALTKTVTTIQYVYNYMLYSTLEVQRHGYI